MTIRVVVADDQDLVRTGLRLILGTLDGIEVVGEAGDGREAVRVAREQRADVCLMDIRMPVLDGVEATRLLAGPGVADPVAVVVITTFDLDEYVHGALRAGASGFLLKDAGPQPGDQPRRGRPVGALPHRRQVRLGLEQRPEPGPHHALVVGDDQGRHAGPATGSRATSRVPPAGPAPRLTVPS